MLFSQFFGTRYDEIERILSDIKTKYKKRVFDSRQQKGLLWGERKTDSSCSIVVIKMGPGTNYMYFIWQKYIIFFSECKKKNMNMYFSCSSKKLYADISQQSFSWF